MIKYKNRRKISKYASIFFIIFMLAVTYVPILILVVYSFTDSRSLGTWTGFTMGLYKEMFADEEILTALANSLIIAVSASLLATLLGTAAAVGIFYLKKFPKALMNGLSQVTMINADIVTGIGFMLFFMVILVPEGYITLIIAHTIICCPYVIMSVMPRLSQLNPNVYEAGLDLGASHVRTFFTVVVPQLYSGMIAGFMLSFTISLDDFIVSKYINGTDVKTIPIYLYEHLAKKGVPNVLRALSALLFFAVLIILLVINIAGIRREKKLLKNGGN